MPCVHVATNKENKEKTSKGKKTKTPAPFDLSQKRQDKKRETNSAPSAPFCWKKKKA
ncbi:hypothetical protein GE21DRAFT_1279750 [Neurospora crassa]|nr:hypothetical protein GE21DRAFT_1279750 [Neurospora crassa]